MSDAITSPGDQAGKITSRDRQMARVWQWAPWLALVAVTFTPPALFWLAYLLASSDATVYLLLAFSSFPIAFIAAVILVIMLVFLRRRWTQRLRERLASDGITMVHAGAYAR